MILKLRRILSGTSIILVDEYIEKQKSPQKEILRKVRAVTVHSLEEIDEKKIVKLLKLVKKPVHQ